MTLGAQWARYERQFTPCSRAQSRNALARTAEVRGVAVLRR